jgi:hypothetical protein
LATIAAHDAFVQGNANTGNGSNLNNFLNNAATTTQTGSVTTSPMTQTVAGGVDIAQYFSNPDYKGKIDTWMGNNVGAPAVQAAQEALSAAAGNNTLKGVNVGGGQTTPFTGQVPSAAGISTLVPSGEDQTQNQVQSGTDQSGISTLVPSGGDQTQNQVQTQLPQGGDQTQTQIQTQPPQGGQVSLGGGEASGMACPAPWIKITMAGGGVVNAGDIKPGMLVYTRHETTGEWGNFPVTAVEQGEDTRWSILFESGAEFVGTFNHRVMTDKGWTEIQHLQPGDSVVQKDGFAVVKTVKYLDHGPVVKIEIQDAHTYLSEGVLSHNIKMQYDGGIAGGNGVNNELQEVIAARGGLMALAMGGMAQGGMYNLGSYSDGGRLLRGPGDGVSDSIPATIGQHQPARLADGEFVIPARIVSELGNGSTDAGARKLYDMMARVQQARGKTMGKNSVAINSRADRHLPV